MIAFKEDIPFDFTLPGKIHFEPGCFDKIAFYLKDKGSRFLIVSAREENVSPALLERLLQSFKKYSLGAILYQDIIGMPDSEQIDSAAYFSKKSYVDAVVGVGSLTSFHVAKSVALLNPNSLFAEKLLENANPPLEAPPLPLFLVPHEPSMGEEFLFGFSLIHAQRNQRLYFHSPQLFAQAVFYDPDICTHFNNAQAAKVMSALMVYAVEMSLAPKSTAISLTLLAKSLDLIKNSALHLYEDPKNQPHITQAFWANAMLGATMPNAEMGAVWAIAMSIEGESGANFQQAAAVLLPHVMEYFLTSAPTRLVAVAKGLGEDIKELSVIEASIKGIESVRKLYSAMKIPMSLSELYVQKHQIGIIAQNAILLPQIGNAPKQLTVTEIESILLAAL